LLELKNEVEGIRMQLVNRVERLATWQEERDRKLLEAIREIQKRRSKLKKESQFNRKMELNIEIKRLEQSKNKLLGGDNE